MPTSSDLDRSFQCILERMIMTGRAPNYEEIARELGVPAAEGRRLLHKLFSTRGFPGWFQPNTDTILSFAPFSNAPNDYRLTIEGEQKWFGQ